MLKKLPFRFLCEVKMGKPGVIIGVFSSFDTATSSVNSFSKFLRVINHLKKGSIISKISKTGPRRNSSQRAFLLSSKRG